MSYIYLLSNEAMPDLVKVGMTTLSPETRANQLTTTGVPGRFVVEAYWECEPDELAATERKLHKLLMSSRAQANREFFRISIDDAKATISRFFARQDELALELERKQEERRERDRRIEEATRTQEELVGVLTRDFRQLVEEISVNRSLIHKGLEKITPAASVIAALSASPEKTHQCKIISSGGWNVSASAMTGIRRGRKNSGKPWVDAKVYIQISAKVRKGLFDSSIYGGYFSAAYDIASGRLDRSLPGNWIAQRQAGVAILPDSLSEFLCSVGLDDLSQLWLASFGATSEIRKQVAENLVCPACETGTLVRRTRRKDGKAFLGCSKWPDCHFTFNVMPDVKPWCPAEISPTKKTEPPASTEENHSHDEQGVLHSVRERPDSTQPTFPPIEQRNKNCHKKESDGFGWWQLFIFIFIVKVIAIAIQYN